jgi:aspartyl/asparaginyl-tRNA synthetase
VQALLIVTPEKVSKQMVKWAAGLADESIVLVEGIARKTIEPIKSASVSDVEVHISQVENFKSFPSSHLFSRVFCTDPLDLRN